MDYCLFLKVANTGNNLDGGNECPIQIAAKLLHVTSSFSLKESYADVAYSLNEMAVPDEPILDVSATYCGITSKVLERYKAKTFLEVAPRWSRMISKLSNKNIYIAGWDLLEDDLRVLESNMKRLSIDFPQTSSFKVIDVKKLAERLVPLKDAGKIGLDIVTYNLSKDLPIEFAILTSYRFGRLGKDFCEKSLNQAAWCMFKLAKKAGFKSLDEVYSFLQKPQMLEVFTFGKHKGEKIADVYAKDNEYLCWLHSCKDLMASNKDLKYTLDALLSI